MELLGLPLGTLATVFAGVGTILVVLYLLKLRRRRVQVPSVLLWARVLDARPASRLLQRLKRVVSLLLQLLLLALMLGALGDPRPRGASARARTLVLLLDGSASMKATDVPGGRAHQAREAARRIVREMGPADRMLIAQMDARVTALCPMSDDPSVLEASLREYAPRDTGADLAQALRFAMDVARGQPDPEVIVVGDGAYDPPRDGAGEVRMTGASLRFVPVGRRGRNVGISAFAVRRYPLDKSRYEALLEVRSWSDRTERVELTLLADGTPIDVTHVTLAPGATSLRVLPDRSGADGAIEARIALEDGTRDDLPADDRAFGTLPERRRARVLVVSEGNRYLEAALLLDEYLEVSEALPSEAAGRLRAERFDVVVFDRVAMPVPEGVAALWLRPEGSEAPVAHDPGYVLAPRGSSLGVSSFDHRHPITRFMTDLEEVHVGRIVRYRPEARDRVVASGPAGPMIVAGERHGGRFVLLAFDPRESDLPLLVAWPLFVINTIDWFAGEDPAYLSSFRTGTTWRIPVPAGVERAEIETPSGHRVRVPVYEGRAVYFGVEAGLHRLHAGEEHRLIASNLSELRESDCAPRRTLEVAGVRATPPRQGRAGLRRALWIHLLVAALGILFIEWWTYHRRVTV
jgi:hypothetical protein